MAALRPELAFFAGAFRAVDLEVDRRAAARFVEVLLPDDFFADAFFAGAFRAVDLEVDRRAAARFVEVLLPDDFFADAFFVDLDRGGLA